MANAAPATIYRVLGIADPADPLPAPTAMWGQLIPASPGARPLDLWGSQNEYAIGRHPSCDFVLPYPKISNRHCALSWDPALPEEVRVEDCSTNGTFINGVRIGKPNRQLLRNGDELRILDAGYPEEHIDCCHRYIYRHLGGPCLPSVFDEYNLFSAPSSPAYNSHRETGTHGRELRWKSIHTLARKVCAVIVIRQPTEARGHIPNMMAEARKLMDAPGHPNVLAILAAFSTRSSIQLVMEHCVGETLLDMILQHPDGMDEARARSLSRDICAGLVHLHARRIFVPTLLPESVMLVADRATIDVSRAGFPDYGALSRVHPGARPSPLLAPEWPFDYVNPPGVGNVWSAGMLGALMMTGRVAPDEDVEEFEKRLMDHRAPIAWEAMETKSAEAQDWVQGMLKNDRHQRMTLRAALEHPWLTDAALSVHED